MDSKGLFNDKVSEVKVFTTLPHTHLRGKFKSGHFI